MPAFDPALTINGIVMPVTTTSTTTFNGTPSTQLVREWTPTFNPITFTKSGSNISVSADYISIELQTSNFTTTYRLSGITVYRSDNSTILTNGVLSNSSLTNPTYKINATNIDSTSITAGYIYITGTAKKIENGEETDTVTYNFKVYFNTNDSISSFFTRKIEYNNTLSFSIFTKTSSAAGFGKEINSFRTNITATLGVSDFTSGATVANRTVTSSLSDLQTIKLKNINQTGTNQTVSFKIEGFSSVAGSYASTNTLVDTVNYNVNFVSDDVISINSVEPEELVYNEDTTIGIYLGGTTFDNISTFSIQSLDNKIIGTGTTSFGTTKHNFIAQFISTNERKLPIHCKQTAKENGTGNLKLTLYDSSNSVLQELTFGMTLTYTPKNVLTSVKTNLFKRVPDLKRTGENNSQSVDLYDGAADYNIMHGELDNDSDASLPTQYGSDNEEYTIIFSRDDEEETLVQYIMPLSVPSTSYVILSFRAIAEDLQQQNSVAHIKIVTGNDNDGFSTFTDFDIDVSDRDQDDPKYYEFTIYGDFSINNIYVILTVGHYGAAICGFTCNYISNTSTNTPKRPNALMIYTNPKSTGDGNPCGLQKTQVYPPIYDITLGELSTSIPIAGATNNILTTSYSYSSNISNGTLPYLSAPISYSADSPNTSITANIYATSGNTGRVIYRTANLSSLNSTYLGTYISCYVNAKSESTTQDSTHFCRIRFYSWADDDQIGSTSYITNTSFSKHTIANRVWITKDRWNNYYKMQNGGVYVELGVANYGGLIRGITIKLEYIKYNNKITFPVSVNRYGGPVIKEEVNTTGYTYLRSGAIKMIYSANSFQNSNLTTSNTYFNTSSYSIKNNTIDNANTLSYTNDSYTLFLKTSNYYSSEFKIPDNGYLYNSYSATLEPNNFGYYFCGYFTLPNTPIWQYGNGSSRQINYTGTNILDWDSSSYISRYRLTGFSGFKGWTTKRTPIEWTASWNSTSLKTVNTFQFTVYSNNDVAGIFVSTNHAITVHKYRYAHNEGSLGDTDINILTNTNVANSGTFSFDGSNGNTPYRTNDFDSNFKITPTTTSGLMCDITLNQDFLNKVLKTFSAVKWSVTDSNVALGIGNRDNHIRWSNYGTVEKVSENTYKYVSSYKPSNLTLYMYIFDWSQAKWSNNTFGWIAQSITIYWVPTKWKYQVVYTS